MKTKEFNYLVIHHDHLVNKQVNQREGYYVVRSGANSWRDIPICSVIWKEQVTAANEQAAIDKAIAQRGWV